MLTKTQTNVVKETGITRTKIGLGDKTDETPDIEEQIINIGCENWHNGSDKVLSVYDLDGDSGCMGNNQMVGQLLAEDLTTGEVVSERVLVYDGRPPGSVFSSEDTA